MPRSIYIATPVYEKPLPNYGPAVEKAKECLSKRGHRVEHRILEKLCYVHTARNRLTRDFLISGFDELLWWDADISADPYDIVRIVDADREIVGASAPYRGGDAVAFPTQPMRDKKGHPVICPQTGQVQVLVLPTALMKVRRDVFARMAGAGKARPIVEYDRSGKETTRYLSFFDFTYDEATKVEFGEDVTFCRKWHAMGGKMWSIPDIDIRHGDVTANFGDYLRGAAR